MPKACTKRDSFLETADTELRRASAITNQALRFHRQATRPQTITFEELIADILVGRRSRITNSHISVDQKDRTTRPVVCFEGEIRQVLSNLIGNAIDAMHGRGGTLFLRGRDGRHWRTEARGMVITIADTGTGMSKETQARLFDAFYTTKGIGGTGLGLWISKEILDRHDGRIAVRSSERLGLSGSVFSVFLPYSRTSIDLAQARGDG
ncbi:sensor histidine kinase [Acidipila sp. EB88]|uniref:sensor histidine kinase n=1 Tax=Acidipila sp. EB88 TaxID=2305226 RepID=UPI000F5E857D|nr:sensor histidine kinase [Acidipila sp. EB88]